MVGQCWSVLFFNRCVVFQRIMISIISRRFSIHVDRGEAETRTAELRFGRWRFDSDTAQVLSMSRGQGDDQKSHAASRASG